MAGVLKLSSCSVDLITRRVERADGELLRLTTREADLLSWLVHHQGRDVPREELLTRVWGYAPTSQTRAVDTTMARLRRKVEAEGSDPEHLLSITGVGYRFIGLQEPAVQPAAEVPSSVPRNHDVFVGRRGLVGQVPDSLVAGAVVSIVGTGGMGKSRLASEIAIAMEQGREVRWIALHGCSTLVDFGARVAMAVGTPPPADVAAGLLAIWAVSPSALWVLDDADGALELLKRHLPGWRERVGDASWMVTSRRPLGVAGEHIISLSPLNLTEARSLFDARCRSGRPAGDSEQAVTELLELLDGHPLAIELAAGRAGTLGAGALLSRSKAWLDLLADRRQRRPARHSSLRASLDASWEGLSVEGRDLWLRLAELACTVDVELVEALAGFDGLTGLEDLDEHSLLHRRDGRWRMPEIVRAYGRERLDGLPDAAAVRQSVTAAVFAHGEGLVAALAGEHLEVSVVGLLHLSSEIERQQRVATEPDDVARAYLCMSPAMFLRGLDPERTAQRRALAAAVGPVRRAEVCAVAARHEIGRERNQDEEDLAQALAEEALALAKEHGVDQVLGSAQRTLAVLARNRGEFDEALRLADAAAEAAARAGRPREEALSHATRGLILARTRQPFDDAMLRALRVARAGKSPWAYATAAGWYANLLDSHGRSAEAMPYADAALQAFQRVGDTSRSGWLGLRLVAGWRQRGEWEYAMAWLDDALSTFLAVPSSSDRPIALSHRAALAHNIGDLDMAEEMARRTIEASQDALLPATEALGHLILADVSVERERLERAQAHAVVARELGMKHNSPSVRILIQLGGALVDAWQGGVPVLPEPDTTLPRVLREHARRATLIAAISGQRDVAEMWLSLAEEHSSEDDICVLADLAAVRDLLAGREVVVRPKEGWAARLARRASLRSG